MPVFFNRRALIHLCGFDQIDYLITDKAPEGKLKAALGNTNIIIADGE